MHTYMYLHKYIEIDTKPAGVPGSILHRSLSSRTGPRHRAAAAWGTVLLERN